MKNKIIPKNTEPPIAKKSKNGILITSPDLLKKLCLDTFVERLTPNQIKPEFEHFEHLKNILFEERLEFARKMISDPWEQEKLDNLLKKLKS